MSAAVTVRCCGSRLIRDRTSDYSGPFSKAKFGRRRRAPSREAVDPMARQTRIRCVAARTCAPPTRRRRAISLGVALATALALHVSNAAQAAPPGAATGSDAYGYLT